MVSIDSVRNRYIGESRAQGVADIWNDVYPAMRRILNEVIKAQRGAEDPTMSVVRLERLELVRRELGQLDRGTFKGCTRSSGSFSVYGALRCVDEVLRVTSVGAPERGAIYRLAAVLADVEVDCAARRKSEAGEFDQ